MQMLLAALTPWLVVVLFQVLTATRRRDLSEKSGVAMPLLRFPALRVPRLSRDGYAQVEKKVRELRASVGSIKVNDAFGFAGGPYLVGRLGTTKYIVAQSIGAKSMIVVGLLTAAAVLVKDTRSIGYGLTAMGYLSWFFVSEDGELVVIRELLRRQARIEAQTTGQNSVKVP